MKDFRILWLGRQDANRMMSEPYCWRQKLAKEVEVIEYGFGFDKRKWNDVVWEVDELEKVYNPDLILIAGRLNFTSFHKRKCPAVTFMGDPHSDVKGNRKFINENKIDMSLHTIRGVRPSGKLTWGLEMLFQDHLFEGHYSEYFPWSVEVDIFKNPGYDREYDVSLIQTRRGYGLRTLAFRLLAEEKVTDLKVLINRRPRNTHSMDINHPKYIVRHRYAKALGNCKMMIFGTGKYGYAVSKYFEGMACGTLILATEPADSEELHFVPGYNFVEVNAENFIELAIYYRDNPSELEKIARQGEKTIHKYHTHEIRVGQFLKLIEKLEK